MQKVLIIIHAPPYGSERCLSALRLALMLAGGESPAQVTVFLMGDAAVLGLPGQQDATGNTLGSMVEKLVELQVPVKLCRTCAAQRGIVDLPLIPGCTIGNLTELAQTTLDCDKVLTF